MINILAFELFS